jgi:HTH-type transcriptional regulator / antitoxin HipB
MRLQVQPLLQRLVSLRQSRSLSQRQLAERLELPQSYLSNVENGKVDIRLSGFVQIARYLGFEVMLVPQSMVSVVEGVLEPRQNDPQQVRPRWASAEAED